MIPNIHICHSERTDGHLQFMYKPITDSLVNMFNKAFLLILTDIF